MSAERAATLGLEESLEESLDLGDSFNGLAISKGSQISRGSKGSRAWKCHLCTEGESAQPRARCAFKNMLHRICKAVLLDMLHDYFVTAS